MDEEPVPSALVPVPGWVPVKSWLLARQLLGPGREGLWFEEP